MLIKDICSSITDGSHNPPQGMEFSSYLMLSSKNVFDDEITLDEPRFLSEEDFEKENKRTKVKYGDVLLTIVGTVGRAAVVKNDLPLFTLQRSVAVLHPNENVCIGRYLMYALRGKRSYIESHSKGVAQKGIYLKEVAGIDLPVPSKEIQEQIIEKLDKVNSIIKSRQLELVKLDELIKARFVELFGDPDINPRGWDEVALSEKLDVIGGYAFKSDQFDEERGVPVLRIGNINAGFFRPVNLVYWQEDEKLERYAMYPGDLVMSLTGTVGKDDYGNVCILGNDYEMYYLNQRNAKLEIKEGLDKHYLLQLLKFEQIKKKLTGISRGVRQANISNKDILNLVVPVPPMGLQNQYADFVEQVDKSKFKEKLCYNSFEKKNN